jgi:hypothetical protein
MHRRSLERFAFDSVLAPYNYIMMQNDSYAHNFNALLATCRERSIAVQTMKTIAYTPWMDQEHTHTTWYKPLEKQEDIDVAVWWALAQPSIFLATPSDLGLLPKVLDAASRFDESMTQASLEGYLAKLSMVPLFG